MFYRQRISLSTLLMGSCLLLSLLYTACTGVSTSNGSALNLVTPDTLTVGSDTNYPPKEFADPHSDGFIGFDIDLITAMAQRLGLKTKIFTTGFDTILDGLNAKRFDVVISSMGITSERKQQADFVHYFNTGTSLLVRKGNPKHITALSDLCGLSVGVQADTIEQSDLITANQTCQTQKKPSIHLNVLEDEIDTVLLLQVGDVDATYQDSPVTTYYLQQNPGDFAVGGLVTSAIPEGIAIRKGDTAMFTALQTAFNQLKADGTYHQLLAKWGLESGDITVTG
ncbi:MAG: ABC transporter substrate-binding protein [Ktedonobacteraceae bacterium]|nr:ABC transporter substrate-binding protein [Ktedonobacteraceae bacterium]